MFDLLVTGIVLGLSAGLAPGPLLTLVIAETLRGDAAAGIRVALAPLVTDLPLILLTLLLLTRLSDARPVLGVISLIGGGYLLVMGYGHLRSRSLSYDRPAQPPRPRSLARGALANVLSPYPYLFWLAVGGPLMAKALPAGLVGPGLFIVAFYAMLVGSKVVLAILVGRSKGILTGPWLILSFRLIGLLLCLLGLGLLRDGWVLLGMSG
ncbi:Lysine exporter protein (LYSE/YGGA) [Thiocapsa sp. KS1]|nr:LysE family transporter [Thiocapsa sp. KS1]CRI66607.1 Lysine exporter protein (LYSE/YGGA) [Thiocapsa sp. KS1]